MMIEWRKDIRINMNEIIQILMQRDEIAENEARNIVEECRMKIQNTLAYSDIYSSYSLYNEITDIIMDRLGLELDYLEYIL